MSTTFVPAAPFNHPQYGEVLAPVAGIEGANFSNTNAARVLDRMGLPVELFGEAEIDTFDAAVQALVPALDEGDEDARRLMQLHQLARLGRELGATHITWA